MNANRPSIPYPLPQIVAHFWLYTIDVMRAFLFHILLISLLVKGAGASATPPDNHVNDLIQNISASIAALDTRELSACMDHTVELTYSNTRSTLTRGHALGILNDFYEKNRPTSFKVEYTGASPAGNGLYILGSTATGNGTYKLYFFIKQQNGKLLIEELKIVR